MAQAPRPNKKCMKLAYQILQTPKDKQQQNQREVPAKKIKEWFRDSSIAQ
jgi:hypothetical protein